MEKPIIFHLINNFKSPDELINLLNDDFNKIYDKYDHFNPITYACNFKNGSLECLINYLKNRDEFDFLESFDETGDNALHLSCRYGIISHTKFLLENGFSPNILNIEGKTPLIIAVESKNRYKIYLVRLLVRYGANINTCSPITAAIDNKDKELILFLLKKNVNLSDLQKMKILLIDKIYSKYILKKKPKENDELLLLKELYKSCTLNNLDCKFFYNKMLRIKLEN